MVLRAVSGSFLTLSQRARTGHSRSLDQVGFVHLVDEPRPGLRGALHELATLSVSPGRWASMGSTLEWDVYPYGHTLDVHFVSPVPVGNAARAKPAPPASMTPALNL